MGQFACIVAEQNNLELLRDIVHYGGDVTVPKMDGNTALHLAVSEGNVELVKFLLEQGADVDKADNHGWTPRNLADQQGQEEIRALFQAKKAYDANLTKPNPAPVSRLVARYSSEPVIGHMSHEGIPLLEDGFPGNKKRGQKNFHNSLFGMMSAANVDRDCALISTRCAAGMPGVPHQHRNPLRVTISCPEMGNTTSKLVLMPGSLKELLHVGAKKFGFLASRVLTREGAEVDNAKLVRDGDHLLLVSDGWMREVYDLSVGGES